MQAMFLSRCLSKIIRDSRGSTDVQAKLLQSWLSHDQRHLSQIAYFRFKLDLDTFRSRSRHISRSRVIDQSRKYTTTIQTIQSPSWQTQFSHVCTRSRSITTFGFKVHCLSCSCFKRDFHCFCLHQQSLKYRAMGRKGKKKNKDGDASQQSSGATVAESKPHGQGLRKMQQESQIPTKINLVVIGTGGPGTSQSLLLTTEYSRFMFNCGEGTQRLAAMSKGLRVAAFAKITGLDHIFITHKSWENTGGLLGMAMTLEGQKNPETKGYATRDQNPKMTAGKNNPEITVHGPPGVEKIAMMAKKFSVRANMNIAKADGVFENSAVRITPVIFTKDDSIPDLTQTSSENYDPAPKRQRRESSPTLDNGTGVAFAYICQAKPPIPKINVEKCVDAGITIGPMVGKLQRGESVVLDDGTIVHPDQVTDVPETDNRPFLIVECPSMEFLPSLGSCKQFEDHMTGTFDQSFSVVVHMTPASVYNSTEYQSWMKGFHKSTDHLVMNRDASEAELIRVKDHQARLNLVSNDVFPLFPDSDSNLISGSKPEADLVNEEKEGKIVKACSGLLYVCRGKKLGFQTETDEFNCKNLQETYLDIPEVEEQLSVLRQSALTSETNESIEDQGSSTEYPKVVFLGTGSSEPNRIRAQSCIVVHLSEDSVIILDCGEDSYGQLYRFYGSAETKRVLRKVKAMFISHLHADHHLGLFSLLKERKNAFDEKQTPFEPVLLMAPIQMRRWLKFYQMELEPVTHLFRFVKHQQSLQEFQDGIPLQAATFKDVEKELSLSKYEPVEVVHCHNAYGVALTHSSGFKLVYSGDTRPCDKLVSAGESCDLLIHEATHEDSLLGHAQASKHSTFSEAIGVGERMKAKYTILTHFSQRYPHMIPLFDLTLPQNVGIAFDNMLVNPRMMKHLSKMIPSFTALFADELQKLEIKQIKRSREQAEAEAAQAMESN